MASMKTPSSSGSSSSRVDRTPPYSEEAEKGVLGAALLEPHWVIDLCIEKGLAPMAFYSRNHQSLFETLLAMFGRGEAIDSVTLSERLRQQGELDRVGGVEYITDLLDYTPTAAHAEGYIQIVYEKFLLRTIIEQSREAIDRCYGEEATDAEHVLSQTEQSFFQLSEKRRSSIAPWKDVVKLAMTEINTIFDTKTGHNGIPTGFKDMDRVLQGLQATDMIILAARPSMGKTSLAMNIAEQVTLGKGDGKRRAVGVFSLEMSNKQLVRRMICCRARVSSHKVSGGYISPEYHGKLMRAAEELSEAPFHIDDSAGLEVLELRSRARRMKRQFDIELLVIDYLQLLNHTPLAREGRQRETAAISGHIKAMAKELDVPVVVLSQLSRAPETRSGLAVPKLSDLRDSGSIEQDADVVMLLRRPCKYPEDDLSDDRKLSIVNVAKHRNGPTGEIHLNFEEDFTRFEDRSEVQERGGGMDFIGEPMSDGGYDA